MQVRAKFEWPFNQGHRKTEDKPPIDILIGCPVQKREWVIGEWFWHALAAVKVAGLRAGFVFVMDVTEEPLYTMIQNQCRMSGVDLWIVDVEEEERSDRRQWDSLRYQKMVDLRNLLLDEVRRIEPPLFLSLDSDILLHEDALVSMINHLGEAGAIGSKTYLTRHGTAYPNYGNLNSAGQLIRQDHYGVVKVQVLMAVKLMTPAAYNINYEYAAQGEDIGWSKACKKAGLKLMWDGTIGSKHVMNPDDLERIDVRVGY